MPTRLCAALARDSRGAVFVEKLIVYLPLLLSFFVAWDLAELAAAKLVVQRASAAAGRAAVVVLPDDPAFYAGEPVHSFAGARREDIELAAGMVLSAIPKLTSDFVVDVSEPPDGVGAIEVTVSAPYRCGVASLMCAGDEELELAATTRHTYHGARYAFSSPGGVGSGSAALTATDGSSYRRGRTSSQSSSSSGSSGNNGASGSSGPSSNTGGCNKPCTTKPRNGPPDPKAKCRYLYRSDGRPASEVFANGMSAWGGDRDIFAHVEGSRMRDSAYVATTYDENTAYRLYWQTSKSARAGRCIYKIRDCGCGFDVKDELNKCRGKLSPKEQEQVDRYSYQKEVVLAGGVRAEDIVSVTCPNAADEPAAAPFPGGAPVEPVQPTDPGPNASLLAKTKYKLAMRKYRKAMQKYQAQKAEYDRKLDAYTNWPPESAVQMRGTTTSNSRYSADDAARKKRPCE